MEYGRPREVCGRHETPEFCAGLASHFLAESVASTVRGYDHEDRELRHGRLREVLEVHVSLRHRCISGHLLGGDTLDAARVTVLLQIEDLHVRPDSEDERRVGSTDEARRLA